MDYILLMTLSGSGLFIGYLCLERVCKESTGQCVKYRELVMVLLTYIIPWVWLKNPYSHFLGYFWHAETIANEIGLVDIATISTKDRAYVTKGLAGLGMFTGIWLFGAFSLVAIKCVGHVRKSRALRKLAISCPDKRLDETICRLQRELGCRRKPEVFWTRVDNETFTSGTIKPVIYLQKDYAPEELYPILKHEMVHIARGDLLLKLVAEFATCLHWLNPFMHMLRYEMQFRCEASCDEHVLRGGGDKERGIYANLLDGNKYGKKLKAPVSDGLDGRDEDVENRVRLIHQMKPISVRKRATAIGVFVLLVFLDSLTAMAYPKIRYIKVEVTETAEDAVDGNNFFLYKYAEEGYNLYASPMLYDEQFVSATGQIYPIDMEEPAEPCVEHAIESGYLQKHIKNEDNSCKVETYESTRCATCGEVWKDEFYMMLEYDSCIH